MMTLLLAFLLQQAPTLTEGASQELAERKWEGLALSQTGKYLVVGEIDRVQIRDARTLELVKVLERRWTAFGFDERDDHFLIVSDTVVRYSTRDWSVHYEVKFPGALFSDVVKARPLQAMVLPDLDFYYVTRDGRLALGTIVDRKVESKEVQIEAAETIDRVLLMSARSIYVGYTTGNAAISHNRRLYLLVASGRAVFAGEINGHVAVISPRTESLYSATSIRIIGHRDGQENECAALDDRTKWVFVGDGKGLRGWWMTNFETQARFEQIRGGVLQVTVDPARRALYTLEKKTLRRWTISD
jgi:hypothetical protein